MTVASPKYGEGFYDERELVSILHSQDYSFSLLNGTTGAAIYYLIAQEYLAPLGRKIPSKLPRENPPINPKCSKN